MQRFSGLLLIAAGASLATFHLLPKTSDGAEQLAEVTRISAAPDRDANAAIANAGTRTFSSSAPLLPEFKTSAPSPVVRKSQPQASTGWTTVVIADPASTAASRMKSSKPGDFETRVELARNLQRELARVGCYGGEINGAWTAPTRRAMAAFVERVNASLPIDEPDYILLTLVQAQAGAVCGATCPSGQALADNGRCVPNAVVAQATRKARRDEQRRRDTEARQMANAQRAAESRRFADERERAEQQRKVAEQQRQAAAAVRAAERQRLADAKAAAVRAAEVRAAEVKAARVKAAEVKIEEAKAAEARRVAALNSPRPPQSGAERIASTAAEDLPWLKEDRALAAIAQPRAAEPLPGRMAIGAAPVESPAAPPKVELAPTATKPKTLQQAVDPQAASRPAADGVATGSISGADVIVPPVPRPAIRPARVESPLDRVAALEEESFSEQVYEAPPPALRKKNRRAKIAKRPAPVAVARPSKRKSYYAYNGGGYYGGGYSYGGRSRRGLPRPGSAPYMMMRSMGGGGYF